MHEQGVGGTKAERKLDSLADAGYQNGFEGGVTPYGKPKGNDQNLSLPCGAQKMQNHAMNSQKMTIATLATLSAISLALADEFKTMNGKEYNDATVTRVDPDGIMVRTKSVMVKLYFVELPKDVQERFHYAPAKAAQFNAAEQAAIAQSNAKAQQEADAKGKALAEQTAKAGQAQQEQPRREARQQVQQGEVRIRLPPRR